MNIVDVVRIIFKVNSKDIRTVWDWRCAEVFIVDFEYIQESIWIINKFFFFFRHAFVSFQQTFTCTKATETLEEQRYQNNVNVFVLVSLSLPFFSIFYTFLVFLLLVFNRYVFAGLGHSSVQVEQSASTACAKQLNYNVFLYFQKTDVGYCAA